MGFPLFKECECWADIITWDWTSGEYYIVWCRLGEA